MGGGPGSPFMWAGLGGRGGGTSGCDGRLMVVIDLKRVVKEEEEKKTV